MSLAFISPVPIPFFNNSCPGSLKFFVSFSNSFHACCLRFFFFFFVLFFFGLLNYFCFNYFLNCLFYSRFNYWLSRLFFDFFCFYDWFLYVKSWNYKDLSCSFVCFPCFCFFLFIIFFGLLFNSF